MNEIPETAESKQEPMQIQHWIDNWAVVTPPDGDSLVMSFREIADACRKYRFSEQEWAHYFAGFVAALNNWASEHVPEHLNDIVVTTNEAGIRLVVVIDSPDHQFAVLEHLPGLEIRMSESYPALRLATVVVPDAPHSCLRAFVNPKKALSIYAQSGGARDAGSTQPQPA